MEQQLPVAKVEQFINNTRVIAELAKPNPSVEILKSYQGFGGLKRCFWDRTLFGLRIQTVY